MNDDPDPTRVAGALARRGLLGLALASIGLAACSTTGIEPVRASGALGAAEATLPDDAPVLYFVEAFDCG